MCVWGGAGGYYVHQGRRSEEGEFPYQTLKAGEELATQKGVEERGGLPGLRGRGVRNKDSDLEKQLRVW